MAGLPLPSIWLAGVDIAYGLGMWPPIVCAECEVRTPFTGEVECAGGGIGITGTARCGGSPTTGPIAGFRVEEAAPGWGTYEKDIGAVLMGAGEPYVGAEEAGFLIEDGGDVLAPFSAASISSKVGGATREMLARKETRLAREPLRLRSIIVTSTAGLGGAYAGGLDPECVGLVRLGEVVPPGAPVGMGGGPPTKGLGGSCLAECAPLEMDEGGVVLLFDIDGGIWDTPEGPLAG